MDATSRQAWAAGGRDGSHRKQCCYCTMYMACGSLTIFRGNISKRVFLSAMCRGPGLYCVDSEVNGRKSL